MLHYAEELSVAINLRQISSRLQKVELPIAEQVPGYCVTLTHLKKAY
jgi:hypothetical protein